MAIRSLWKCVLGTLLGATVLVGAGPSRATVVERVVAVVGDHAVLLSDLRTRALPYLARINQQVPVGAQRSAAISQLYETLLQRLVDEQLQDSAAQKAQVTVSTQEVSDALERVARQNGISVERLMQEAQRSGMTDAQYRQEIRRQLLEAKLLNVRVQGRIQVSDEEVRAAYHALVLEQRKQLAFQIAWVLVKIDGLRDDAQVEASRGRADEVARAAREGMDFAALARKYSADTATRAGGGLLPPTVPGKLPSQVDQAVVSLEPGEVSTPIRMGNHFVVVKLLNRAPSDLPPLVEAEAQVRERVYTEKMAKARERWMENLKRQTHVDLRL